MGTRRLVTAQRSLTLVLAVSPPLPCAADLDFDAATVAGSLPAIDLSSDWELKCS